MVFSNLKLIVVLPFLLLPACQSSKTTVNAEYTTIDKMPVRDSELAQKLTAEGLELARQGKLAEAENILRNALAADVSFGPAHHHLGTIYFKQNKYYLAAWEFQYAIKLMPHHPEPRNNLGLVLETVGKLDDAVKWYGEAMTLQPDRPELIGNLARAKVRRGDSDKEVRDLLGQVVLKDTRPEWVQWARTRLATLRPEAIPDTNPTPPQP